jgi:hypothetical protein
MVECTDDGAKRKKLNGGDEKRGHEEGWHCHLFTGKNWVPNVSAHLSNGQIDRIGLVLCDSVKH